MRRHKSVAPLTLGVIAAVALGCSENTEPGSAVAASSVSASQTSPARQTLTNPKLQPPPQRNKYTDEWRPEVVFDPCTWISDDTLVQAGLDPSTRRRGKDFLAEYTFLTCNFEGKLRELQVDSGNVTWEEDIEKNGPNSEPLTVNGRQAMWVRDPHLTETCDIHLRTKAGFVILSFTRTFEGSETGLQRCDGVLEIAQAIEPEIGAEN
ncbi:hypothetical protein B0T36_00675 [Nocardia donostiensis]|nr:hypothetical protein B0T36_00675 [Nocardia donostiensis]